MCTLPYRNCTKIPTHLVSGLALLGIISTVILLHLILYKCTKVLASCINTCTFSLTNFSFNLQSSTPPTCQSPHSHSWRLGNQFPMSGNSFRYRKLVCDVGKQFPVSGKSPELFPISENRSRWWGTDRKMVCDVGKRFPVSGNSPKLFPISENRSRCRETFSDVGKWFAMSGNGYRCRGTVPNYFPMSETVSDFEKRFPISENGFRCWGTVSDVGQSASTFRTRKDLAVQSESGTLAFKVPEMTSWGAGKWQHSTATVLLVYTFSLEYVCDVHDEIHNTIRILQK